MACLALVLAAGVVDSGSEPARAEPAAPSGEAQVRPLGDFSMRQLRVFLKGVAEDWRGETDDRRGLPPPPSGKRLPAGATVHELVSPEQFSERRTTISEAISRRRSRREFRDAPLTLEELSFLLWHAQGITGSLRLADGSRLPVRAAPSGGARYPLETYVFVHQVETLETGLYRYLAGPHQLAQVRLDSGIARKVQHACFGVEWIGKAAAVVVFTAVPYRTEWRYGTIAHRLIAMEAGHASQNLLLCAEAMGLGSCAVAAYHQPTLDTLLGVDGEEEFALYLTVVGRVDAAAASSGDRADDP